METMTQDPGQRAEKPDFLSVTELTGDEVSQEQLQRVCNRYYWAGDFCRGKDVVEAGCGTGQGLGFLAKQAKSLSAGDFSEEILSITRRHYGSRIELLQFDAQKMPFADQSKDVILLFEALYYIPSADRFVKECRRVLRMGGRVLIATANKDLFDFNPSPYTYRYYGVVELAELFERHGFSVECLGDTPVARVSWKQKLLRPIKKIAVGFNLVPKTMAYKKILKRIVFGRLVSMPPEIAADTAPRQAPARLPGGQPDRGHKVIFCAATLR
jgi:SAM-dependent methyltransferase